MFVLSSCFTATAKCFPELIFVEYYLEYYPSTTRVLLEHWRLSTVASATAGNKKFLPAASVKA